MADRPIIFSAPMVRALLEGRKTQTRRVLCQFDPDRDPPTAGPYFAGHKVATWTDREGTPWRYPGVKGAVTGDRLYVREAFAKDSLMPNGVRYVATDEIHELRKKRPSIHMPRWASRLTLTVTEVRVQRLQDITGRDMIAEGVRCQGCHDVGTGDYSACRDGGCFEQRGDFIHLWNSLHGPEAWDANPWVVALTFTVQHGNIDKIGRTP